MTATTVSRQVKMLAVGMLDAPHHALRFGSGEWAPLRPFHMPHRGMVSVPFVDMAKLVPLSPSVRWCKQRLPARRPTQLQRSILQTMY